VISDNAQVIEQTTNPVWDETIIFPGVKIYGRVDDVINSPPMVLLMIYDFDDDVGHFMTTMFIVSVMYGTGK
jgi:hypothetical protein